MAVDPQAPPGGRTPQEIDPSRRPGMGLNASQYSGSTAMNPPVVANGMGQGPQTVASGDLVYWGQDKSNKPVFISKSQANNAWLLFPDPVRTKVTGLMDQVFGKGKWKNSQLQYYWGQAVGGANYGLYANNQYLNPIDLLPTVLGQAAQDRAASAGGGGGGGTSRSTQIRLTDPQGARALIDQALTQYLGRTATAKEQKAFLKALNVQEARNPTVTTVSRGGGGTTAVTTGGFNPSTFAQEYAQGMEGSAEFQAATTYLDAFIQALKPVAG